MGKIKSWYLFLQVIGVCDEKNLGFFCCSRYIGVPLHENIEDMQIYQVINRHQPGSIAWSAFLKLAALLAKPPTLH